MGQSQNINQLLASNKAADSNVRILMSPDGSITVLNGATTPANSATSLPQSAVPLSGKLPIPKIKKPVVPPAPSQGQVVLQLGTDGRLYTKPTPQRDIIV